MQIRILVSVVAVVIGAIAGVARAAAEPADPASASGGAAADYSGIYIVESVPPFGPRENCLTSFIDPENAISWWIGHPIAPALTRVSAAQLAEAKIGQSLYSLQFPKGPYTFTCVGLVEYVYEQVSGGEVNLTSWLDELDGFWPHFFPDEQFASSRLSRIPAPLPTQIEVGDIVYRDTRGIDIIPGDQDHVGIVCAIVSDASSAPATSQVSCVGYAFAEGIENCGDQVDNDLDGAIDGMDTDCGGAGLPPVLEGPAGCGGRPKYMYVEGQLEFSTRQPATSGEGVGLVLTMGRVAGEARVAIYDIQGRLVRTMSWGSVPARGTQRARWDGKDQSGRPVAPGVYVVRFTAPGVSLAKSVVVVG